MFNTQLLDVAIGMVFVYLAVSLICSGINEWIAHLLDSRARGLESWLRENLKGNDAQGHTLAEAFKNHPLIKALAPVDKLPSYILPRTFLLALLDTVAPVNPAKGNRTLEDIRTSITRLSDEELRKTLFALLDSAGNDLEQVRQNIEGWFNDAMERLSGSYKRRTRFAILALALVVTVALNVNSLRVFGSLYRDSAVRAAVAAAAQQTAQQASPSDQPASLTRIKEIQAELQAFNLPIGWSDPNVMPASNDVLGWILTVLGWLITALAASQGAPFWFDTLNRLVNVRATGARPPTTPSTAPSEDRRIVVQPAVPLASREQKEGSTAVPQLVGSEIRMVP